MALLEQAQNSGATENTNTPPAPLHPAPFRRSLAGIADETELPQLLETLLNEFRPDSPSFEEHVRRTAEAELLWREEQTRFDRAYRKWLENDPSTWDAARNRQYREMKSRADGAHRTYLSCFNLIERTRRNRLLDGARLERSARAKAKDAPPPKRTGIFAATNTLAFIQVISIRRIDGELKTSYCPTNQEILGAVRKADHPRITVRRRFMLQQDLPAQYDWVRGEDGLIPRELNWTMTKEEFEADAEEEQADGTGYVLPSKNALAGVRTPTREIVLK